MRQLDFVCDFFDKRVDKLYEVRLVRKFEMRAVPGITYAELCHECWRRVLECLRDK